MNKVSKNVLIMGASSGIGYELARHYAIQGYKVAIAARRNPLLKTLKKEFPDNIFYRQINITERDKALLRIHSLIHEMGGLDIYIHTAAVGHRNIPLDYTIERDTIHTNVEAFTAIVESIYKYFRKKNGGHIVNISSVTGLRGVYLAPAYSASKAYQISMLESLRAKAVHDKANIHVTDIRPGFVDTAMGRGNGVFWVSSTSKVARQIAKAIRQHKRVAYVTRRWAFVAFLIRLIPGKIYDRLA